MMSDDPESHFDHQDWRPIILAKSKARVAKDTIKVTKVVDPNIKLDKQIVGGKMEHTKITIEMRTMIQKGRASRGLTQKGLANMVNLPVSVINEIESGRAIYNHVHVNKIKRSLGIK